MACCNRAECPAAAQEACSSGSGRQLRSSGDGLDGPVDGLGVLVNGLFYFSFYLINRGEQQPVSKNMSFIVTFDTRRLQKTARLIILARLGKNYCISDIHLHIYLFSEEMDPSRLREGNGKSSAQTTWQICFSLMWAHENCI